MKRTALAWAVLAISACGGGSSANPGDGGVGGDATTGDDAQPTDAASGTDAPVTAADARAKDSAPDGPPPPTCGTGSWLTYGHDAARTFASDACIRGPLTKSWAYTPVPPSGRTVNGVHHAIAASDGVYLQWAASDGQYIGTTAADRVSLAGARVWTFDSGSDANMANWASLATPVTVDGSLLQSLVLDDDGVYFIDLTTGRLRVTTGVDWWGQTIPDPQGGVWFTDTSKSDGPGLFVGELGLGAKAAWEQNKQGTMCGQGLADQRGGLALDGGVLFYAPLYTSGGSVMTTFKSGLYAFDAATGMPKWSVASTPASVISAGGGLVYGIEADAVVARSETDGSVTWSRPLSGAGVQAPVLASGLVIAAGSSGVSAFQATSGAPAWSTPLTGAAAFAYQLSLMNTCAGLQSEGAAVATSMAAALPSGTLVVTASDGVHVLSLATGADTWHGPVPGAMGPVHDPVLVGDMVYVIDSPAGAFAGYGAGQLIALQGS